ncbi:MAG: CPBP family intramembrane metalloprotease [Anaerolineae bacterium]|nr:CPBP family intramembrane metalloprotease [Anaerolineae bacterium]
MKKHPVVWFYLLAFATAWLGWVPIALGSHGIAPFDNPYFQFLLLLPAIGPAFAAILVTRAAHGKAGVRALLRACVQWRTGVVWYLVAVLGPLAVLLAAQGITKLLGLPVTHAAPQGDLLPMVISALVMALLSNPFEEMGWRGFALPHLQKRYTALPATLVVGVLWGLWHLPLFFWAGNPISEHPFLPWLISTVAAAFVYTWLYNSTKGSILLVALFHVALNTFGVLVPGVSVSALAILYSLAAIALVAVVGSTNLSRQERTRSG